MFSTSVLIGLAKVLYHTLNIFGLSELYWGQLVPAVTELVIAELLYLQWMDPRQPTYVYINSTGTSRADGETVSECTIRRHKAVK